MLTLLIVHALVLEVPQLVMAAIRDKMARAAACIATTVPVADTSASMAA